MEGRINTSKTLHNSYFDGDKYDYTFKDNSPMQIDPMMSEKYDYAITEDPELLMERKKNAELIHEIYTNSEYSDGRFVFVDRTGAKMMRITKESIPVVFNYIKDEFLKQKSVTPFELIIAINEYFDFPYKYIWDKVLTPQMKFEVLEECRRNGMGDKIDDGASVKLF